MAQQHTTPLIIWVHMATQSPSFGAGFPTPPKPPTEGLQSRALSGDVSGPGKRRPPVTRFGRVRRPAPNRGLAFVSTLSRFPLFSRGKSSNTPKTLPWTDKFCQIVRKLKSHDACPTSLLPSVDHPQAPAPIVGFRMPFVLPDWRPHP